MSINIRKWTDQDWMGDAHELPFRCVGDILVALVISPTLVKVSVPVVFDA